MKRSDLPTLPPHVNRHKSPSGVVYYRVQVSTRLRLAGFSIPYYHLGTNCDEAMKKYDEVIRPRLKAFLEAKEQGERVSRRNRRS